MSQAVDSSKPLVFGSIVKIIDQESVFYNQMGLVIKPDYNPSTGEVAVFFDREVPYTRFDVTPFDLDGWDRKYFEKMKSGNYEFLLEDSVFKGCPRIVIFEAQHFSVEDSWDVSVLAERMFPRLHHTVYDWPKGVTGQSSLYICFLKDCDNPASKVALYNFVGSVYPLHTCNSCFVKVNGMCGECFPELKNPLVVRNPANRV